MKRLLAPRQVGWILALALFTVLGFFNPSRVHAENSKVEASEDSQPVSTVIEKQDLTDMSLENLTGLNVVVTSSAKKSESLRDATSAIYVITGEEIRKSGLEHLAELLRLIPGVQVNQNNANEWAISARGFNAQYNNKMLVLIDGRSVYEPDRGGVIWRDQDLLLEDIDHIEVIRGPGGSLWGLNAVNGIINVITKDSKVTQGLYVSGIRGTLIDETNAFRYGDKSGDDFYYRVYGKNTDHRASQDSGTLADHHDDWNDQRIGFRADWHGDKDVITFQGDYQQGRFNYQKSVFNPYNLQRYTDLNTNFDRNGNLLARWVRTLSDTSEGQLLASYDMTYVQTNDGQITAFNTADVEFQHRFLLNDWNEITWGGGFRNLSDQYQQLSSIYIPPQDSLNTYSGFLQDKLTLVKDQLYFTGGVKMENNIHMNDEIQPSARLSWTPDSQNSLWAAFSRAVRAPNRIELSRYSFTAGSGPVSSPNYTATVPNPGLDEEELLAYELGYRTSLVPTVFLDLATFFNRYTRIIARQKLAAGQPSPIGGQITSGSVFFNTDGGSIWGLEASVEWKATDSLKVLFGYSLENYDPLLDAYASTTFGVPPPANMFNCRIYFNVAEPLCINTAFYYSDATHFTSSQVAIVVVPSYLRWDLGATWRPASGLEVSLCAQNLQGTHTETIASKSLQVTNIVPSGFLQFTARY